MAAPKAAKCELVHICLAGLCCSIRGVEGVMTEQPAKRIPEWLTTDMLVILVSLAIIVMGVWIAP